MTYRTPELQLVGAAQGIVLSGTSAPQPCAGLDAPEVSRANPQF